jgi:formate dehydrogenase subunit delta
MSGAGEGADEGPDARITTSSLERLVYMANQIGRYFSAQPREDAAAGVADHLARFWDPRMRAMIREHLRAGGAGLDPAVRDAVARLAR